jgi:hypothetical protein
MKRAKAEIEEESGTPTGAGRMLNRPEAARQLGISESTLRRRIEGSVITPVVGPDGVHRFCEQQVKELIVRRVQLGPPDPAAYDGPTAAAIFALFDEGLTAIEVVKRTQHDPRLVGALRERYASLQGGFFITAYDLNEIEGLTWLDGSFPIQSASELIANLKSSAPDRCDICKKHEPKVCAHCTRRLAWKRAAELADESTKRMRDVSDAKHRARANRDTLGLEGQKQKGAGAK